MKLFIFFKKIEDFFIKFLELDKLMHFFFGFLIYVLLIQIIGNRYSVLAFWIVFIVAILKEIFDFFYKRSNFDLFDIAWTVLPALVLFYLFSLN